MKSSSIQTVEELREKKIDFQEFVQSNYLELSHSDLIRRLVSQYFMMHEYVRYHQEGSPAGDILLRYQQEVLAGVRSLLMLVQDDIPGNKLLNYIIGFYYNRGMVTFASFIANNFRNGEKRICQRLSDCLSLLYCPIQDTMKIKLKR
ncbi:MAG: hypothetical protein GY702_27520 [Desulfobulbaceae bacterium]|nr:hypothetical protein [Desulfobulbaceae bacterium]